MHVAEDSGIASASEDSGIANFSEDSGNNNLEIKVLEDSIVYCGGFARTGNLHDLMFGRIRPNDRQMLRLGISACGAG